MGTVVKLDVPDIVKYYNSGKSTHSNEPPEIVSNLEGIQGQIQSILVDVPETFDWEYIKQEPVNEQKRLWTLRHAIFSEVLIYVVTNLEAAKSDRSIPQGFALSLYKLSMFGSQNPSSDIDVTVEGPDASFLIANLEDAWIKLTGHSCRRWDVEFYGDFLMFLDETAHESFLNSREFGDSKSLVLPYVGVSILRNAGNLDFVLLNNFIKSHPEIPELQMDEWKKRALQIMGEVKDESYDEQREKYYTSLAKAEAIRKEHIAPNKASNLSMFMLLCEANIYRSENYILPSTVIHVVRDIQAKARKPASPLVPECRLYHARLATCALGRFTYLCSAMEQIGYMERFSYDSGKVAKYKGRLELALKEYAEHSQSGGKRSYSKRSYGKRSYSKRYRRNKAKKTRKLK